MLAELTQVVRVSPGHDDLRNLARVDDRRPSDRRPNRHAKASAGCMRFATASAQRAAMETVAHGIAAASIAAILNCAWVDLAAAFFIGMVVGVLVVASESRPRVRPGLEALSALLATLIAMLVDVYVTPLTLNPVVLASLIVLMPGLTLTTAVRELSTQHLVSGTARLAGAVTTLMKLAFGTVMANQICLWLHLAPIALSRAPVPQWAQWLALAAACYSFAVLFRAAPRHAAGDGGGGVSYLITYYGGREFTPQFGVFSPDWGLAH
jgi:uncharacterized membrane protein YjjB (DUF3815 family)